MRDSDYDWREQAAIRNRQLFAERHGNSALGVTLLRVKERLDRQYELMSANKGGAPGKAYRGLAIRSLVKAFESATSKPATGTAGGLFVKVCAAAFPLLGIPDWADFDARLLVGTSTVVPRTVACPIRMPFPPAKNQGSIYENQTALERRYFDQTPAPNHRQQT